MAEFPQKYMWSSKDFERWVKCQQKRLKRAGFSVSTAGVTHKLLNEVLIPGKIDIAFPTIQLRRKKKR